ncbi:MAG: hypothetical protein HYS13_25480 [Planctomycetia bacterium]|nr:hypothetical protein [Planctomycetia bacterium]
MTSRIATGDDGLAMAVEAWKASSTAVTSGEGTGTFLYEKRNTPTGPWKTITDARVSVFFDKEKYHIRMECSKEWLGARRRIIIHDGSAIFSSRFVTGAQPVDGQGEVFLNRNVGGMVRPEAAGVPWDVSRLPYSLGNLPLMVKKVGAENIAVTRTAEGDYILSHAVVNSPNVRVERHCLRQYGYNIGIKRLLTVGQDTPTQEFNATWKKAGHVWYIASIEENSTVKDTESETVYHRWKLSYDNFTPNAAVPASRFSFAALELPGGARILDHRPATAAPIRYVPVKDAEMEAKMDSLVEQLNSLPSTRPKRGEVEGAEGSIRWWVFGAVNALVAITVIVLLVRMRRRKTA